MWGLAGLWLLLAAVAVVWGLDRVEGDIEARAADALAAAGFRDVTVEVDGRDVRVEGVTAGETAEVEALLDGIEGLRAVDFGGLAADVPEPTVLGEVLEGTQPPTTTVPPVPTTTTTTMPEPAGTTISAPFIEATLLDGQFSLSGIVPDEATAQALLTAATIAYAPFVDFDVDVIPGIDAPPWLEGAPTGITLLPMISEGTIRVQDGQIRLTGASPRTEYLTAFEDALGLALGLPDIISNVEITDLDAPLFVVRMSEGTLELSGVLPSAEMQEIIVGGAVAAYGAEAVVDQTDVGDGLYTSFWMYTMPGVFELFRPFPTYDFKVEEGVTSGALRGGASFQFDSAELTPDLQQLLGIGAAILTRDLSLATSVEGHTDSVGDAGYNQGLSELRAQNAADFLVAAGVAPERLRVAGFGEERPLASNATAEGREVNRRVEFVFGPAAEVLAP